MSPLPSRGLFAFHSPLALFCFGSQVLYRMVRLSVGEGQSSGRLRKLTAVVTMLQKQKQLVALGCKTYECRAFTLQTRETSTFWGHSTTFKNQN
jgi:hypothetical protein